MQLVVDVLVRKNTEIIQCDAGEFDLNPNDGVLVETEHGIETGIICQKEKFVEKDVKLEGKVLRPLNEEDIKRLEENKKREREAIKVVHQKIEDSEINMHLTAVEYNFDRSKLFIYYTAESRVDFREFIKSLGHTLKTRIQMVQIGARDETKILGGFGICGRKFCCATFLKEFSTVTIDMAKHQDLPLNIQKLSGACGRLMCCLSFEDNYYCEERKKFPKVGLVVVTPLGEGEVLSFNCLNHTLIVELSDGIQKGFKLDEVKSKEQHR